MPGTKPWEKGRKARRGKGWSSRGSASGFKGFVASNRSLILQTSSALLFGITAFAAGFVFGFYAGIFRELPGLIILIPAVIATRGNIFGAMASRMGTRLHTGEMEPRFNSPGLGRSWRTVLVQTMGLAYGIAFLAHILSNALGFVTISALEMVFIATVGSLISTLPLFISTISISTVSYRKGYDPDNVTIPLVTALGDLVTMPAIIFSGWLLIIAPEAVVNGSVIALTAFLIITIFLSRMEEVMKVIHQSIPFLTISAILTTVSGLLLNSSTDILYLYPAILVLLPPFNVESGNIGSVLAARLSSANYLGLTKIDSTPDAMAMNNFRAVLLVGLMIFPIVGLTAAIISITTGIATPALSSFLLLVILAGVVVTIVSIFSSYYVTYLALRIGYDPDNVVVPIITSLMDLVATITILGFAILLL